MTKLSCEKYSVTVCVRVIALLPLRTSLKVESCSGYPKTGNAANTVYSLQQP